MKKLFSFLVVWGWVMTVVSAQIGNAEYPVPPDPKIKPGKSAKELMYFVKQNKNPELGRCSVLPEIPVLFLKQTDSRGEIISL